MYIFKLWGVWTDEMKNYCWIQAVTTALWTIWHGCGVVSVQWPSSGKPSMQMTPNSISVRWWKKMYATTTASKSACQSPDDYVSPLKELKISSLWPSLEPFQVATIVLKVAKEDLSGKSVKYQYPTSLTAYQLGVKVDLIVRKSIQLVAEGLDFWSSGRCDHDLPV